jgi:WXG100 family type VII secretion target
VPADGDLKRRCDGVSDRIVAELRILEKAAKDFETVLIVLRRELAELDRDLRASLALWEGDAANAYWAAHDEWQAAADDMAKRLAFLRRTIATAHGNYRTSLHANVTMWDV